jgi:hypothetical protein
MSTTSPLRAPTRFEVRLLTREDLDVGSLPRRRRGRPQRRQSTVQRDQRRCGVVRAIGRRREPSTGHGPVLLGPARERKPATIAAAPAARRRYPGTPPPSDGAAGDPSRAVGYLDRSDLQVALMLDGTVDPIR